MEIDQFFKDLAGSLQAISCCHISSLTQWDLPACLHTSSALHSQISDILFFFEVRLLYHVERVFKFWEKKCLKAAEV